MRRKTWVIITVLAAIVAISLGATSAFANGGTTAADDGQWETGEYCDGMMGGGMMGGYHMGLGDAVTLERVADTLGLTYEQLTERLAQGETITEIATAEGVAISLVVDTVLAPHGEMLQVLVQYGYLSDEQAQTILEQARVYIEQATAATTEHEGCDMGGGMMGSGTTGRGMMGGGTMGGGMMGGGMMGGGTTGRGMMGGW